MVNYHYGHTMSSKYITPTNKNNKLHCPEATQHHFLLGYFSNSAICKKGILFFSKDHLIFFYQNLQYTVYIYFAPRLLRFIPAYFSKVDLFLKETLVNYKQLSKGFAEWLAQKARP